MLERQTPAEGPTASLGWEWSLLNQLVHQEQRELPQPRAPVFSVAISPDGKLIASGDELSEVHIWDYTTGEHLRVIDTQQIEVNTVDFSPDSKLMATAGKDGTLRIWSVGRWNLVGEPLPHDEEVYCVAFAPNGQWFATGGRDKRLRAWRLGASQPEVEWEHPDDIEDLDISPDGQFIVTGCHDGHVRLWPRDEKEPIWDWEPDSEVASISCVRYTPDGRQVAVCPTRTQIQFLDSVDGHPLMPMEGVTSYVSTCRFTPDGTTIVFGCHDGSVHLRRAPSTTLYRSYDEANKVDVSPDGQFVASAGQAGSIDVFNTVAGEIVLHDGRGTGGPFPSVAISPDGKTLAYAGIAMSKWDLALGQQLAARGEDQWQLRKFRHLEYSPDGKLLAAAATDGTCRLYPADTYPNGEPAVVLERLVAGENGEGLVRDKEEMTCCDFSPDGSMIATSSNNDLVTLWDVKTGALLHEFKDHQADAVCVQFSPDGKLLAGGYQDGVT
ncbi:MAG: WD40 repeat domain-containing protein, partial [Pirellulales bacterium]